MLCKNLSREKNLNNKCEQVSLFFHVTRLLHHSARFMNELRSLHHSQSVNNYFVYIIKNNIWLLSDMKFLFSCSTRHLTRELSSLTLEEKFHIFARPCIFSLRNFLRIPFIADLMLTIFFLFVIFNLLSCWISSANNLIWMFVTFVITIEVVSF